MEMNGMEAPAKAAGEIAADGAAEQAATLYDLQPDPEAKVDVRRLPRLAREAVAIVWQAARGDFLVSTVLQAVGGVGVAVQLLLGQRALQALLTPAAAAARSPTCCRGPWPLPWWPRCCSLPPRRSGSASRSSASWSAGTWLSP